MSQPEHPSAGEDHLQKVCGGQSAAKERSDLNAFRSRDPSVAGWYFRPTDPDPQPSIPHGHWRNKAQPKLDAYRGVIWQKHPVKSTGQRLSRSQVGALWNDPAFREMARKAVIHMIDWHPSARGIILARGVAHPLRMPRRR